MSEPYLILHKVRGEPAFDIAERVGQDSDGEIWIIPTSGHRAYPINKCSLVTLLGHDTIEYGMFTEIPTNWPDHYACNDRPIRYESKPRSQPTVNDLMELLK